MQKNGLDYIKKEDADIVGLQETKCDSNKLPNEVKIPGYERYFLESKNNFLNILGFNLKENAHKKF